MKNDAYEALIQNALKDLYSAAGELEKASLSPRQLRSFVVIPGQIIWPHDTELRKFYVPNRFRYKRDMYVNSVAHIIMQCCPTPWHVLRALRRIRAITAWCRARREEASNEK